ncbi:MAG TPA: hypothetical protein VGD36_09765 [Xanthobacteraceae bacterium]|jgi:hypothetical protein
MTNLDPDTPFPRHRRYYIILKIAVVVLGAAIALRLFGVITWP